jgi:hypothetical protein
MIPLLTKLKENPLPKRRKRRLQKPKRTRKNLPSRWNNNKNSF